MPVRLNKVIAELNVALDRIGKFLAKKGKPLEDADVNAKISDEQYKLLAEEFGKDKSIKDSTRIDLERRKEFERKQKEEQRAKKREAEKNKQGIFRTDTGRQKYTPVGNINDLNKERTENKQKKEEVKVVPEKKEETIVATPKNGKQSRKHGQKHC